LAPSSNWNLLYQLDFQVDPPPATTSFLLACLPDFHFVNQISNFSAVCGWDG
jgi:hypothetical protein